MKKGLSYIWTVTINLITIFIIYKILSITDIDFERIVLCGLILIYLSVNIFMSIWGYQRMVFTGHFYKELKDIKKLLDEETNKYAEKEFNEFEEKKDRITIKYFINSFFRGVTTLITLYYLFQILF